MERVVAGGADAPFRVAGTLVRAGVARFSGIAYAERPGWDAPRPIEHRALIDATRSGSLPPQPGVPVSRTTSGSFLSVSIDAPWPPAEPRPVLVWLCVAGNIVGRADAAPLAASRLPEQGAVVVGVQARLGAHGFAVLGDAPDDRTFRDWIAALRWVRRHVAMFGGDPARVTVAGQSAGGGGVSALLASRGADGLFAQAIVMSAATPSTAREPARIATERFAERLGVDATAAAFAALPTERLVAGVAEEFGPRWRVDDPRERVRNMRVGPPFRLVDAPDLDVGPVLDALAAGSGARVPLLVGSAAEEFTGSFAALAVRAAELPVALDEIAPDGARRAGRHRRSAADAATDPGAQLGQAFTDAVFRLTPRRIAVARANAAPTYLYEVGPFAQGPTARHGIDVAAALSAPQDDLPDESARAVGRAWAAFVLTGSPGWAPWGEEHGVRRFGDTVSDGGAELDELAATWDDR